MHDQKRSKLGNHFKLFIVNSSQAALFFQINIMLNRLFVEKGDAPTTISHAGQSDTQPAPSGSCPNYVEICISKYLRDNGRVKADLDSAQ